MENEIKGGGASEIVEVATSQLTEHSMQAELSPNMSEKAWRSFVAGIATNGILQPITATRGFRVIDGKHRLRAAKELGVESVRVVFEDIPEDNIAKYITETKLSRDDLTKGQRACIILNMHDLGYRENQGKRTDLSPNGEKLNTHAKLAKQAGIGGGSMSRLIEVKRKRLDLYAKVFDGSYSIGKAHAEMKSNELPTEIVTESPIEVERKKIEELTAKESTLPQIDESQPAHELNNRLVQMRKKALSLTVEVLDESEKMHDAKPEED